MIFIEKETRKLLKEGIIKSTNSYFAFNLPYMFTRVCATRIFTIGKEYFMCVISLSRILQLTLCIFCFRYLLFLQRFVIIYLLFCKQLLFKENLCFTLHLQVIRFVHVLFRLFSVVLVLLFVW